MIAKSEVIKESKYGRIIWEDSTFTSKNLVGFGISLGIAIVLTLFLLPISILCIIIIVIRGTFISNLAILIFCICLAGVILFLFFYILFMKNIFFIKFTESHLLIKRRVFGIPKRFELSNLWKVEIRILKETEWSKIRNGTGWYATVKFTFMIATIDYKEKNYSFLGLKHIIYL